ncbi:MAG: hypothetical protein C0481_01270 [Phenylobacterium sp.]|uniref:PEPxxWA-CTERM sorting domain-containing protein n=1 Tax=Phenylobacterium sp. TaxID=1871053 RepID=UPI0025FCCD88|nr:PEPxxWA-CTERM sorting domain-containing protein [Phenylobacterium sp.]MBA4010471.1 hypothetical protein [Phenylobacterium sp.]
MTNFKNRFIGLLATTAVVTGVTATGAAAAEEDTLAWSSAYAGVGVCQVGVTCGQPNGVNWVARRQVSDSDVLTYSTTVGPQDYLGVTNGGYFGNAWASAEAGQGLLALPELHAYAESRSIGLGYMSNPFIGVDVALVQAVQAYTNTSGRDLIIPLSAFQGVVDFGMSGAPGTVSAGIAVLTDVIARDPAVASLWSAAGGIGHFGEFSAGCGTAGALAFGQSGAMNFNPGPQTQYLNVAASSCGGDSFTLAADETFYVWARLGVSHSAQGATDASHTFNVSIAPVYQDEVEQNLAPALRLASGANLDIPISPVPEPSTWALMITGFGAAGAALRRRKSFAV